PACAVPFIRRRFSTRSFPSLPPCSARPPPRSAGAVLPRSASELSSAAWFRGVPFWSRRPAAADNSSALAPQPARPLRGALPVATRRGPFGATTAPARAQIAESLDGDDAGLMRPCRLLQSELHTCTIAPLDGRRGGRCPWYGGASPT